MKVNLEFNLKEVQLLRNALFEKAKQISKLSNEERQKYISLKIDLEMQLEALRVDCKLR